jgi:hypothetical protein
MARPWPSLSCKIVAILIPAALMFASLAAAPARAAGYATCGDAKGAFRAAAAKNGASIDSLDWAPFGAREKGWAVYEFLLDQTLATTCGAGTSNFAEALAAFQARYKLTPDGVFSPETFEVFKGVWQEQRAFVMARVAGFCPEPPAKTTLVAVPKAEETFDREDRMIRQDVLGPYEKMLTAARTESSAIRADPKALTIFSGYRSPDADEVRCETEHNCDGTHRASCSAHRTGAALDLDVGWVQGVHADDASLDNRMMQTRTPAYKWMVRNAARFGFVNYPFEPWHWEYVGATAGSPAPPPPIVLTLPH